MTQNWEPGVQYNYGDVVRYEGRKYRIIQPHRSQGDWAPSVTPALWGLVPNESNYGYADPNCMPDPCQPPSQQHQQQQPYQPPAPAPQYNDDKHSNNNNQGYYQPQQPQPQPQKHDSDSEGEGKSSSNKWLGIAAGAAGAALLGGAGIAIFKHHENSKAEEEWIAAARQRTNNFYSNGPTGPCTWILNHGKSIPPNAIVVGQEHSWTLYIARAFHKGSVTPGKASDVFKKGAVIGYAHDEIHKEDYEILVGDMRGLKWVPASGRLNIGALGARPVDGGVDSDGTPLFVARAPHKGAVHPGKISEKLNGAFIPYGDSEVEVPNYDVLCYA